MTPKLGLEASLSTHSTHSRPIHSRPIWSSSSGNLTNSVSSLFPIVNSDDLEQSLKVTNNDTVVSKQSLRTTSRKDLLFQTRSVQRQPFNSCLSGTTRWVGTATLRNINPVYHPHCPQVPHKHSQNRDLFRPLVFMQHPLTIYNEKRGLLVGRGV